MIYIKKKPIVFAGPSSLLFSEKILNKIDLKPPIRKNDLNTIIKTNNIPGICVILDGIFNTDRAISSFECKTLIDEGWLLIGASSMGALRAADLWSLGMIGVGKIYNLYRIGICRSDAEVAVLYSEKNNTYMEITASLVHIRSIIQYLLDKKSIEYAIAKKLLLQLKKIPWYERYWELVWQIFKNNNIHTNIINDSVKISQDLNMHPKSIDANHALNLVFTNIFTKNIL